MNTWTKTRMGWLILALMTLSLLTVFVGRVGAEDAVTAVSDPLAGFDEWFQKFLVRYHIPGASIAVVRNEDVIMAKGYGYRDADAQLPVTPNTLFFIGSCTKAFTSTLAQTFVDEGKLSWDKPAVNYLPQLKLSEDWVTKNVTLLDMAAHRTGYPRNDDLWYTNPSGDRWSVVKGIGDREPEAPIRTKLIYNNVMYVALGCAIERAAKSSWEVQMTERILKPAGMNASKVTLEAFEAEPDHSLCYGIMDKEPVWIPSMDTHSVAPAGGIYSNALDMAKWISLNLGKGKLGGKTIVSTKGMNFVHSPHMLTTGGEMVTDRSDVAQQGYGCGWLVEQVRGRPRISHGGALQGFLTNVAFYPKDRLGWVIFLNASVESVIPLINDELERRFSIGR